MTKTYLEAQQWASFAIADQNGQVSDAEYLMLELFNLSTTQLLLKHREPMMDADWHTYESAVHQVLNGIPPQYVVGHAPFYGHNFTVTPAVLIPRQETEELVEWVLEDLAASPHQVLDIGTGSGAIAVSLKLARPTWQMTASDISKAALAIAQQNAMQLQATIHFVQSDVFDEIDQSFDVIVSNPPYISEQERAVMDQRVIDQEPNLALFADHDGLAIYEQIAVHLAQHLTPAGRFYAEFGYQQAAAIETIFHAALPDAQVTIRQDMAGHPRMLRVMMNERKQ